MTALARPLGALGRAVLAALAMIGRVAIFAADAVGHMVRPPFMGASFWPRCCKSAGCRCRSWG